MTETGADLADPAAYLAAVLDTAERTALDASITNGREWTFYRGPIDNALITGNLDGPFSCVVAFDEGAPSEPQAAHIAANDPAHVLRLVAAHRKLLAMHVPGGDKGDDCLGCCEGMNRYEELIYDWWPCPTIKLLAEAYGWTA